MLRTKLSHTTTSMPWTPFAAHAIMARFSGNIQQEETSCFDTQDLLSISDGLPR